MVTEKVFEFYNRYFAFMQTDILYYVNINVCVSDSEFVLSSMCRLWDKNMKEAVKTLSFDASVSSMEYIPDGEILVITYGRTIAFYNAHR